MPKVFPASAGMNRTMSIYYVMQMSVPRKRGDEPDVFTLGAIL